MPTFGLPESLDNFEDLQEDNALNAADNIKVIPPSGSHFLSNSGHSGSPELEEFDSDSSSRPEPDVIGSEDEDEYFVATQPQTQSQHQAYNPDFDQHLVGCLIPATDRCQRFELGKDKKGHEWTIGRRASNDLVLPGLRLSNHHCKLVWNGQQGTQSQVTLHDNSSNGTWINNVYVKKGAITLLRSGAAISLGSAPNTLGDDYRFIFRDIEGQSTRHANQIWSKYDVGIELGAGAFARVHRCIERQTGTEYAVKIIDKAKLKRGHANEQSVVREISILLQLAEFRHKNIVSLHEHFEEDDAIYLVLELVRGGDLLSYITLNGAIPENQVRRMAAQMCHAIAYFHSQGIAHRDLKPENVMMTATDPPDCKIADFGLAKLVDDQTFLRTMCGTPAYLAPEVILRASLTQAYDNRVDSWSLGVILFCMLTSHAPFADSYNPDANPQEQRQYFSSREVQWGILQDCNISHDGIDFLRNILTDDYRSRKEVAYMLEHPWISYMVPSDSQFQHPESDSASTPHTTDGALACSQSLQNLNLSDMTIPGLTTIKKHAASPKAMSVSPGVAHEVIDSFTSEVSVTSKIPGAFPKSKKDVVVQLAPVEESVSDAGSWEFVARPVAHGAGPSRRSPEPNRVPAKRKSHLIAGSSPLSSLSSDDDDDSVRESPKKLPRRAVPPRSKGKAVEPRQRKLAHPPPSSSRARRPVPKDDVEHGTRKSSRHQPPAKAARYT